MVSAEGQIGGLRGSRNTGGMFWHTTQGFYPLLFAGTVSLLSDRTSDRTRIVLCMCQKMPASKARPDGDNRMSEIQQRNESWGSQALRSSSTSPSACGPEATESSSSWMLRVGVDEVADDCKRSMRKGGKQTDAALRSWCCAAKHLL